MESGLFLERGFRAHFRNKAWNPFSMAGCNAGSFGNRYRVPIEKRFRSAAAIVIGVDIAFLSKLQVRRLTERWQI